MNNSADHVMLILETAIIIFDNEINATPIPAGTRKNINANTKYEER